MSFSIDYLPSVALIFMLIFARVGTMMMLLPGLGERTLNARVRLGIALSLSLVFYPVAAPIYDEIIPETPAGVALLFGQEFAVAFSIGLAARICVSALQMAGAAISMQIGIAQAMAFDPSAGGQATTLGNYLSLVGVALVLITDLHHLVLAVIHDSFTLFPPGGFFPVNDMAEVAVMIVSQAFSVGMRLAMPFLVFGLLFNLGLGLINRMMPQVQIFFIAQPASIFLGMVLVLLLLTTMMSWYVDYFSAVISQFSLYGG